MTDKVTQADRDASDGYLEAEAMMRDILTPDNISDTAIRVARDHMMQFARKVCANTNTELVEALREIVALDQPIDIVDVMNPLAREAVEIARKALSLYGDQR